MVYTFESRFASQIEDFIAQKNALGFGYLESSPVSCETLTVFA